jgi:kynureninase
VAAQYFVRALEAERQLATAESNFVLAQEWRSLMARYFFRANYRGISVNDDVGEEFSTLQDAEAHATIVANELVRNSAQAVTVSVLSEDGMLLAKAAAPS